MDIKEIRGRKAELEDALCKLVMEFERDTGMEVSEIALENLSVRSIDSPTNQMILGRVRVRLGSI